MRAIYVRDYNFNKEFAQNLNHVIQSDESTEYNSCGHTTWQHRPAITKRCLLGTVAFTQTQKETYSFRFWSKLACFVVLRVKSHTCHTCV